MASTSGEMGEQSNESSEEYRLVVRLRNFLDDDRAKIVTFSEFANKILQRNFSAKPDIFHSRLAERLCEDSTKRWFPQFVEHLERVPGAFGKFDAFSRSRAFLERAGELLIWSSIGHEAAFFASLRKLWLAAQDDYKEMKRLLLSQLELLQEFHGILVDEGALFWNSSAFENIILHPPPCFTRFLEERFVYLSDLHLSLTGFTAENVPPVSLNVFQIAATNFVLEHREALVDATASAISSLRSITRMTSERPELDAIELTETFRPGLIRCPLPHHLHAADRILYFDPGRYSNDHAAIPSFRLCAVVQKMCSLGLLQPCAMRIGAFAPIVHRLIAEAPQWALERDDELSETSKTPPPPPQETNEKKEAISVSANPTFTKSAIQSSIQIAIDRAIKRDVGSLILVPIATMVEILKTEFSIVDRAASLTQNLTKQVKSVAEKNNLSIQKNKQRRLCLAGYAICLRQVVLEDD